MIGLLAALIVGSIGAAAYFGVTEPAQQQPVLRTK